MDIIFLVMIFGNNSINVILLCLILGVILSHLIYRATHTIT